MKSYKRLESDFPTTNRKPIQYNHYYLVGKASVCVMCVSLWGTNTHNMLDLGHRVDRQWNVNVCMLTNSTALWMGFAITPHHACRIGPVPGPPILLPLSISPLSLFLTTMPLGQSCGHTTWLLAAQERSWQKQPEARHVEKIQSAHSIHSV